MTHFGDLTLATTVHNNAAMSGDMLRSFAENVGAAAEIVIVDDASEVPVAATQGGSPTRVVRTPAALGFCKASDRALSEVKTPYALLVDADVLFQPGDFAGGFGEFKNGNWAWINFRQINFEGQAQDSFEQPLMPPWVFASGNQVYSWWARRQSPPQPAAAGQRIAPVAAAHSSCALVRMEAFHAVGGFDPWYWQCQSDMDLSLRLHKAGYGVGVDLGYEVKHHGAGGKSGDQARVLDLYRSRVHLYEHFYPASRIYLRPLLFLRHLAEIAWFGMIGLFRKDVRMRTRMEMLKGALQGYH